MEQSSSVSSHSPVAPVVHGHSTGYRADIDGLRAIAVVSVIIGHLGFGHGRGGYVGVDVFFTISGYLIGSLILSRIQAGTFSIAEFYERRIRRIFPALVAVIIFTSILAYIYLLPVEFEDYAGSVIAATFSCSNFLFWKQSGYFAAPALLKPLLHTWSLGVEEQFYILFPLLLLLLKKFFSRRIRLVLVLCAIASLVVSAIGAFKFPVADFYLPGTRAWELLLGTLVWMGVFPGLKRPLFRELAAAMGLVMILLPVQFYSPATPFPGLAALPPCLGCALVIAAGQDGTSIAGKILSWKPIVFIGTISYSLYLWHWPLIVFQNVAFIFGDYNPYIAKFVIIFASFLLAFLSWKFIEEPFRRGRLKLSGTTLFVTAGGVAALLLVFSVSAFATRGFEGKLSPKVRRIAAYLGYSPDFREGTCFFTSRESNTAVNPQVCLKESSSKINVVLVGDSHAAQLWYGLSHVFTNLNVMQVTATSCRGALNGGDNPRCRSLMKHLYKEFIPTHHVAYLILAGQWTQADLPRIGPVVDYARQRGLHVVIFGPIPHYDEQLPRLLAQGLIKHNDNLAQNHLVPAIRALDNQMGALNASQWKAEYISYFHLICGPASCVEYAAPGVPLQFDESHLTAAGSVFVAKRLLKEHLLP